MRLYRKLVVKSTLQQFDEMIAKAKREEQDLEKALADKRDQIKALEDAKAKCMEE